MICDVSYKSLIDTKSHNYAKIKMDLDDEMPAEELVTLHYITLLIKSVLKKNENPCY